MPVIDFSTRKIKSGEEEQKDRPKPLVDFSNRNIARLARQSDLYEDKAVKGAYTEVSNKTRDLQREGEDVRPIVDPEDQQGMLGETVDMLGAGSFLGGGLLEPLVRMGGRMGRGEDADLGKTGSDILSNLKAGGKRALPGLEDQDAKELADIPNVIGEEFGVHPARMLSSVLPALKAMDGAVNSVTGAKGEEDPSKAGGFVSGTLTSLLAEMADPLTLGEVKVLDKAGRNIASMAKPLLDKAFGADNAVVNWARRNFSPKGRMRQSERTSDLPEGATDQYRKELAKVEAEADQNMMKLQDDVVSLSADLSPEDRVLLTTAFRDETLKSKLPEPMREKIDAFGELFNDWFEKESQAGLLSETQMVDDYLHSTLPVTKAGEKRSDDIMSALGVRKLKADPGDMPNIGEREVERGFRKERQFEDAVDRIGAGVPTEMDVSMIASKRGIEHIKSMSTKRLLDTVINDPALGVQKVDGNIVPDIPNFSVFKTDSGAKYLMPDDIVDDLNRIQGIGKDFGKLEEFAKSVDKVMSPWKGYKLLSPGYHVRNNYSNAFQNYIADVDVDTYPEALKLMRSGEGNELMQEAIENGVMGGGLYARELINSVEESVLNSIGKKLSDVDETTWMQIDKSLGEVDGLAMKAEDVARKNGKNVSREDIVRAVRQSTENTYKNSGKFSQLFGNNGSLLRFNRHVGTYQENVYRLAHFLDKRKKGMSPEDAAMSVKKYLFDYGELTDAERQIMKRYMPFYTWSRKNIPLMVETLFKNPSKINTVGKQVRSTQAQFDDDPLRPDYFQESTIIRIPSGSEQNPRYLMVDLPVNDLSFRAFSDALGANPIASGGAQALGVDLRNVRFGGGWPEAQPVRNQPDPDVQKFLEMVGITEEGEASPLANRRAVNVAKTVAPTVLNQLSNIAVSGSSRGDMPTRALNALGLPRIVNVNQPDEAARKIFQQRTRLRRK